MLTLRAHAKNDLLQVPLKDPSPVCFAICCLFLFPSLAVPIPGKFA